MPLILTADEDAFLERVEGYCLAGLSQPQMAEREKIALGSFREKLRDLSFSIESETTRRVVRIKTGELPATLRQRGELVVRELVAA